MCQKSVIWAARVAQRFSTASVQGVILETQDQVLCQAPCMEPASQGVIHIHQYLAILEKN